VEYQTFISIQDLEKHLYDTQWVIVDSRFDLASPEGGFADYQQSHIPGAVYAHLNQDLAGAVSPQSGRHPLPDLQEFAQKLSGWGINHDRQVVVYDTANGAFAARLWWMLQALGHSKVAVLNGGFPLWKKGGLSTRQGSESNHPVSFSLSENAQWTGILNPNEVENIRVDPMYKLIDARSPERYSGDRELIDLLAGHIPGAVNRYHGENLQMDGTIKPKQVIRKEFINILGNIPPDHTVVYCGSGVTSCFHILAMNYCGLFGTKLFPGSWSEWIKDLTRPRYP